MRPIIKRHQLSLFCFALLSSVACSDPVLPPVPGDGATDVIPPNDLTPPSDRTVPSDIVPPRDAGDPCVDASMQGLVPIQDGGTRPMPDVPRPPQPAWCDLPAGPDATVRGVTLPAGFCIRRYARVPHPRVMAFSPSGDLFIASPGMTAPGATGPGNSTITVLADDNSDGIADPATAFARSSPTVPGFSEMATVHGLLFHESSLYFTTQNGVWRLPFCGGRTLPASAVPERIATLDSERWTHTLALGSDGTIYVSMGVYGSSMCPMSNPHRGAILAVGPGHAAGGDIIARGFRNPMYLRCHPWGCYAAELTDDGWSAPGREKIVRFGRGEDYGYPCCYDRNLPSPVNSGSSCGNVVASLVGFPVGYTPFGHDFERGTWPSPYGSGLFVGLHGVVGSWDHTGIRWTPADPSTHAFMGSEAQVFMGGWGRGTPNEGRVADLVFAPDGRMFFTDDQQGEVYWIAPNTLRMR